MAIYKKSKWVGINSASKTHPLGLVRDYESNKIYCIGIHAEVDAILKVPKQLRHKITLYVARIHPNGMLGYSKPCKRCQYLLENEFKINRSSVFYTDYDGSLKCLEE